MIILSISLICYNVIGRRWSPSIFLGIAAGIVAMVVMQPANTVKLPTGYEIGTKSVLVVLVAIDLALGVYMSLMYTTQNQVTIEKVTQQ